MFWYFSSSLAITTITKSPKAAFVFHDEFLKTGMKILLWLERARAFVDLG